MDQPVTALGRKQSSFPYEANPEKHSILEENSNQGEDFALALIEIYLLRKELGIRLLLTWEGAQV